MAFQAKLPTNVFSKVRHYGSEIIRFFNLGMLKVFNLMLYLLLISNKAPNQYSLICSEMNTVSITNIKLLQNEKG